MKLVGTILFCFCLLFIGWSYKQLPMVECAWCHSKGTLLNPLNRCHILPQEAFPEYANTPSNVIVLCRRDHLCLSHRGNWKLYNPDLREIVEKYTNCLPNVKE